jgi:hypothetical protein
MASTFSPSLRLELIGDGDQSGIWGQTTNNNLGGLIEQAITGVITISMLDANYTLANFNGVVDEARNQVLVLTGTLSQQRNLIAPLVEKTYTVRNTTTNGFGVQIIGASGTGVVIPNGQTISVYCDGTNFFSLNTGAAGNFSVAGNLAVTGTTALTGALSGSTAAFSGAISSVSPAFTGTPTAPTAAPGTNTTQIASTAFVQAATTALGLGTMATQNANNVNITGGVITGSYGLTAANATNATTAASCSGNAATASNPAGGGSFITSLNIGGQSVSSAVNATNLTGGSVSATTGTFSGSVTVSTGGATGGGIILADDGDIVDLNNGFCSMRFSAGVQIYSGNRTGSAVITLGSDGNITASQNVTAYSDERLKKNWRSVQDGFVEKLAQLKSGIYDRTDIEATQVGVSAQSLQTLMPEAVQTDKDGMLSVNYGAAALVAAIELAKKVELLTAEIEELKRGK